MTGDTVLWRLILFVGLFFGDDWALFEGEEPAEEPLDVNELRAEDPLSNGLGFEGLLSGLFSCGVTDLVGDEDVSEDFADEDEADLDEGRPRDSVGLFLGDFFGVDCAVPGLFFGVD